MGLFVVEVFDGFDAANDQPDDPKQVYKPTNHDEQQDATNDREQKPDPKRTNLEFVVALQPIRTVTAIDIGHNHANYAGNPGYEADKVKDINDLYGARFV